jgi:hypothetical protein
LISDPLLQSALHRQSALHADSMFKGLTPLKISVRVPG